MMEAMATMVSRLMAKRIDASSSSHCRSNEEGEPTGGCGWAADGDPDASAGGRSML